MLGHCHQRWGKTNEILQSKSSHQFTYFSNIWRTRSTCFKILLNETLHRHSFMESPRPSPKAAVTQQALEIQYTGFLPSTGRGIGLARCYVVWCEVWQREGSLLSVWHVRGAHVPDRRARIPLRSPFRMKTLSLSTHLAGKPNQDHKGSIKWMCSD